MVESKLDMVGLVAEDEKSAKLYLWCDGAAVEAKFLVRLTDKQALRLINKLAQWLETGRINV